MASVKKVMTKSRETRYRVRYRDGDRRSREKWLHRKTDADRYASTVEADLLRGIYIDPQKGRATLEEWAVRWLAATAKLKAKTRDNYESLWRNHVHPALGHRSIASIDQIEVQTWVAHLGVKLSPSRVRQAYWVLSAIFRLAVEGGSLPKSPCRGIRLPKMQRREPQVLDHAAVERLVGELPTPYDTFALFLAYSGLRFGEAAALQRKHCNVLRSQVLVERSLTRVGGQTIFGPTKNHRTRTIALPEFVSAELKRHLDIRVKQDPEALVFTARNGSPLHGSNFRRSFWRPAVRRAGFDGLWIHDLRHVCASLLIAAGGHPVQIRNHLGHSSIAVTMDVYGHLFDSAGEELAAAIDAAREAEVASASGVIVGLEQNHATEASA